MFRSLVTPLLFAVLLPHCSSGGDGNGDPMGEGGVAPGILDTFPSNGATAVPGHVDLLIEFEEPMRRNTVKVTSVPSFQHSLFWEGRFLNLARGLTTDLAANTRYTVTVSGESEGGETVEHTFAFDTAQRPADTMPPTLTPSPADGATDVEPSTSVTLRFSEPMRPGSVSVSIQRGTLGAWSWNSTFDTLTVAPPPGGFVRGSTNELHVSGLDLAGNSLGERSVTFQVPEVEAPLAVEGISPLPGATSVPLLGRISIGFSRDMEPDATRAAITLAPGNSCSAGQSEWLHPRMFQCRPMNTLVAGTQYRVTVGAGARDTRGNALPAPYTATFTAAAVSDSTAPAIVSTTPANGAKGVTDGTPLVIQFSETMDRGKVEEEFRTLSNGLPGRFRWNADNTQLTYVPRQAYHPGLTLEWTADFSEDLSGNYVYEFAQARGFEALGIGGIEDLADSPVTLGDRGTRTEAVSLLRIGDDARNQATAAFLSYDLGEFAVEGKTTTGMRHAYLVLPRVGCDGDVAGLGGVLRIEPVAPGAEVDAADLGSAPTGEVITVENVCAGPHELFVPISEHVRAAFASRATAGDRMHFRLRFATGTDGDGRADRLVLFAPRFLLGGPTLRSVFEFQ